MFIIAKFLHTVLQTTELLSTFWQMYLSSVATFGLLLVYLPYSLLMFNTTVLSVNTHDAKLFWFYFVSWNIHHIA